MGFQIRWAKKDKSNLVLKYQLPHKINFVNKDNTKNLYAMTKKQVDFKIREKCFAKYFGTNFAGKWGENWNKRMKTERWTMNNEGSVYQLQ